MMTLIILSRFLSGSGLPFPENPGSSAITLTPEQGPPLYCFSQPLLYSHFCILSVHAFMHVFLT